MAVSANDDLEFSQHYGKEAYVPLAHDISWKISPLEAVCGSSAPFARQCLVATGLEVSQDLHADTFPAPMLMSHGWPQLA